MTAENAKKIEVQFRQAQRPADTGYPPLNPCSYVLAKGSVQKEGAMPLGADVLVEVDVPVKLRDGTVIRTDVYRPTGGGKCPAIIGWSPYGKRGGALNTDFFGHPNRMDVPRHWEDGLNKFEAPNPAYWVAHGYAIIAPDPRGIGNSEGDMYAWGNQDAEDEYDLIEWVGTQPWSNGKAGLSGNSWLAMTQWSVSALRPPHLAAIAPWEGALDNYRDAGARGGIPEFLFSEGIFSRFVGNGRVEDAPAMTRAYPLMNAYWESKCPDVRKIDIPAYVVASWTNIIHTNGTFTAWRNIGSKEKWLRIHNTHEWTDYYNPDHVDDLRRFFDRYLKGIDNGWEATPRVRLSVLDPGNADTVNRAEQEFPLSRQKHVRYYLAAGGEIGQLEPSPAGTEGTHSYDSTNPPAQRSALHLPRTPKLPAMPSSGSGSKRQNRTIWISSRS